MEICKKYLSDYVIRIYRQHYQRLTGVCLSSFETNPYRPTPLRSKGWDKTTVHAQQELTVRGAGVQGNSPEEEQQERQRIEQQQALVARLEQVKPTGRIVLDMKPTDNNLADIPAMPLEDGDRFFIPSTDDTVQVLGSVYNESSFRFRPGKPLSDYLNHAGGTTREGDKARVFVIRADGSVVRKQQYNTTWSNRFNGMELMPGDAIVVPERGRRSQDEIGDQQKRALDNVGNEIRFC
jgi:SLBB domain-containing protein